MKNETSRISYATFHSVCSASSSRSKRVNEIQPKPKLKLKGKMEEKEDKGNRRKELKEEMVKGPSR